MAVGISLERYKIEEGTKGFMEAILNKYNLSNIQYFEQQKGDIINFGYECVKNQQTFHLYIPYQMEEYDMVKQLEPGWTLTFEGKEVDNTTDTFKTIGDVFTEVESKLGS